VTEWYFIVENGKAKGPLSPAEVEGSITRGDLGPHDLLYRDGDTGWRPLKEFSQFKRQINADERPILKDLWVVLAKTQTPLGVQYLQRGPFSTEKVKGLLSQGEINYRDFIWAQGQKQWNRISALEVFNPPPIRWEPTAKLPQDVNFDDEEVTRDVPIDDVITQTETKVLPPTKPVEAFGEDLTKPSMPPPTTLIRSRPRSPKHAGAKLRTPPPPPAKAENEVGAWLKDLEPKRRYSSLMIAAGVGVVALGVFLYVLRQEIAQLFFPAGSLKVAEVETPPSKPKAHPAPAPVAPKTAAAPSPPPQAAPLPVVPSAPPEPAVPRVQATRLSLRLGSRYSRNPVIYFSTNGSFHTPIKVLILGEAGDVLGGVNAYKETVVRWKDQESPELRLESLDLSNGKYQIIARIKDVEANTFFRIGQDNKEFRAQLARHHKLISLPFQRERRRIIRATNHLLNLAVSMPRQGQATGAWLSDVQNWVKTDLKGLSLDNPKLLVFPEYWREAKDLQEAMIASRNGEERESIRKAASDLNGRCRKISLFK
jgi:hypothetical protein